MGRKLFVVGVAAVVSGCCWASVAEDYAQPVRPVGVNGQEAWNRRSVWFMYAPTFAFTNRTDAASYAFEVTDDRGRLPTFWFDSWEMWPNCMIASARALSELADRR